MILTKAERLGIAKIDRNACPTCKDRVKKPPHISNHLFELPVKEGELPKGAIIVWHHCLCFPTKTIIRSLLPVDDIHVRNFFVWSPVSVDMEDINLLRSSIKFQSKLSRYEKIINKLIK